MPNSQQTSQPRANPALQKRRNPNPSGGKSPCEMSYQTEYVPFEWLPPGASPNIVLKLTQKAGKKHGWTPALVEHLEFLLSQTAASDWRADGRPMVCLSVEETAWALWRSTTQIRRNENRLMQLGALVFRHSPNRQRYIKHNADGVIVEEYGLDLSPIVGLRRAGMASSSR